MSVKTHKIFISNGQLRFIHDDALRPLLALGNARVCRASHVEPSQDGSSWSADMVPSGGPLLGPFPTKQKALDSEVEWLNANKLR